MVILASKQLTLLGTVPPDSDLVAHWSDSPPQAAILRWLAEEGGGQYARRSLVQYGAMLCAAADWLSRERAGLNFLTAEREDFNAFLASRTRKPARKLRRPTDHVSAQAGASLRDDAGATARTRRRYILLFNRMLQHLVALGLRAANPGAELYADASAPPRAAPTFLGRGEDVAYIEWALSQPLRSWRDYRQRALKVILLASGITVAEAQRLKVADVQLPIVGGLEDSWSTVEGIQPIAWLDVEGHRRAARHRTALARWAIDAVRAWLVERKRVLHEKGIPADDGLVFATLECTKRGSTTLTPMDSADVFKCVRPGIEKLCGSAAARKGPQTLRNTFMTRNLLAGRKPQDIQRWTGLKTDFSILALREQIDQCSTDEPV